MSDEARPRADGAPLPALFLVSGAAVGFEIALTRFFAVAKWSEYGYWVISIVMVGFALSGVAVAVARPWAVRHVAWLRGWLPVAMLAAAAVGYRLVLLNPFNPLQLQNPVTFVPQLWLIGAYYAALLPFFFLAGVFVSLCFVTDERRIGRVYGADLLGAAAGAASVLALMWLLPPLRLVPAMLVPLAVATLGRGRWPPLAAAAVLVGGEALLLLAPAPVNDFKAIYAPSHVAGARVLATRLSPRGEYALLDDFTERVDTDLSNDSGGLGLPGPPRTLGLYRDGARLAALPLPPGAAAPDAVAPAPGPAAAPSGDAAPAPATSGDAATPAASAAAASTPGDAATDATPAASAAAATPDDAAATGAPAAAGGAPGTTAGTAPPPVRPPSIIPSGDAGMMPPAPPPVSPRAGPATPTAAGVSPPSATPAVIASGAGGIMPPAGAPTPLRPAPDAPADPALAYAPGTLEAAPYALLRAPSVLLVGSSGGFRVREARALGAAAVLALEPDPVVLDALRHGLGPAGPLPPDPAVRLSARGPLAAARAAAADGAGRFDLVDLSADFLDAAEANASAFTAEAFEADLRALRPGGILSVPVSIRDLPVYGLRVLATAREALRRAGVPDPSCCVAVVRSAWNLRILLRPDGWDASGIAGLRRFAAERSFDLSYYPGIDVAAARAGLYNDLPPVSFDTGEVSGAAGPQDAVADEAVAVLRGEDTPSSRAFDLSPATLDRPGYYDVLRLRHLGTVLSRLEVLPQPEVGQLVNLAVLVQAAVIAVLVLLVPALAGRRVRGGSAGLWRPAVCFAALGLGFLFVELFAIEKASLLLDDRTGAFALVLTGMLFFSGVGSLLAGRVRLRLAAVVILGWCALAAFGLPPLLPSVLSLPAVARAGLVLGVLAPVSVALGMPFPAALARLARGGEGLLPWAWAVNGAFSVVATPLAGLVATQLGLRAVLLCALVLYAAAFAVLPHPRRSRAWQDLPIS